MLTPGLLHGCIELIDLLDEVELGSTRLEEQLSLLGQMRSEQVVRFAIEIGLVFQSENHSLSSTTTALSRGLTSSISIPEKYRLIIREHIKKTDPFWASLIPRGRLDTFQFAPAPVRQCFAEARLLETPPDPSVIDWWDELGARGRSDSDAALLAIGRKGEQLSIEFERLRTGAVPKWMSIESNLVGYDVLSIESSKSSAPLLIEVKASSQSFEYASFVISRHEWEVAESSISFLFHLWLLGSSPVLGVVEIDALRNHIPNDSGEGEWTFVRIPMAVFKDWFQTPRAR